MAGNLPVEQGAVIRRVVLRSPAAKAGARAGERLTAVNGRAVRDVLDYTWALADEKLTLTLEAETGAARTVAQRSVALTHEPYADIGLQFDTYLMDAHRTCQNHCLFCFIDQLPKSLRAPLYVKDDDARLSFLLGNYITLTNLSDEDVARIAEMKISPLRISVHTTDPALRVRLMGNPRAGDALRHLSTFADAGLKVHAQVVCCPGLNDGEALARTLRDLADLGNVENTAVVPVGLTKYREGLYPLSSYTPEQAAAVLEIVDEFHDGGVYAADEWFLKAGWAIPEADYYGEYLQLENGVGLLRLFEETFTEELQRAQRPRRWAARGGEPVTLITGEAAAPFLQDVIDGLRKRWHTISIRVMPIHNDFFGSDVTVAGLVTGRDIVAQGAGRVKGRVLVPDVMLRKEGDLFLDGYTPARVEKEIGCRVQVVPTGGEELVRALFKMRSE
ncbi:MAG: DUF512 domain-containing protein [Oscillospiraceae bacterium]|nr:DUF512 domain-containing protein [Oscillospiraceae bacterium]